MQGSTLGSGLYGWHQLSFGTTQNFHTSTKTTPFEALYDYPPSTLQHYIPSKHILEVVDAHLKSKTVALVLLKQNLVVAQERTKSQADKHWTDREFQERDWLFLKLLSYRKSPWPLELISSYRQGFMDHSKSLKGQVRLSINWIYPLIPNFTLFFMFLV